MVEMEKIYEEYISEEEMVRRTKKPLLGYATKDSIWVRRDLNPKIKSFVRQHELEHVKRFRVGKRQPTWFREELLVSIKAFPKEPIGGILTVLRSISDPRRFKYYWNTYKEQSHRQQKRL